MKKKILFVCLGNICRSPSAEAVMKHIVQREGRSGDFEIDSAGILSNHKGELADMRMQKHAAKRNYRLTSISRPIVYPLDFERFQYIIGMDDSNIESLKRMCKSDNHLKKIYKLTDFCINRTDTFVPDPYYGGDAGFELVLDILEDACEGLFRHLSDFKF